MAEKSQLNGYQLYVINKTNYTSRNQFSIIGIWNFAKKNNDK
jgi:hypothetical protein